MATDARKLAYVLTMKDDSQAAVKSADDSVEKLHGRFTGLREAGAHAAVGIAAVATEAVALGTALFALGSQFDDAWDKIRTGTGATGEAFEGLKGQARAALLDIPTDLDKASTAVLVLNQRLGEGGPERQQLVEDVLELSRLTGTDLTQNLNTSSQIFRSWNVAGEEQSEVLNKLLRAYQATGTSVTTLGSTVSELGPIFRTVGLGLTESIALTAALEREGVQTEAVMRGFNTAIGKLAEQGIAAADALPDLLASIRDMEDPTEATGLAIDLFGSRAGPRLAEAIRAGRLEIDALAEDLDTGTETIAGLGEDTEDSAEKMEKAWNKAKLAAEPLATAVFNLATKVLEVATPAIESFAENLGQIQRLFDLTGSGAVKWADLIGEAAGALVKFLVNLNPLVALFNKLTGRNLADDLGAVLGGLGETLDKAGRSLPGATEAENVRRAEENWRIWAESQKTAADEAVTDVDEHVEEVAKEKGTLSGGKYNQALIDALRTGKGTGGKGTSTAAHEQAAKVIETAIDGFITAMAANRSNLQDRFGDFGASAASALFTAIAENTKSAGASAFREVENIVLKLQKEQVPNWRELGDDLAGAFHNALLARTEETKVAAVAKLDELADILKQHRALTPENLLASLDQALSAQSLGSGAGVLDSLTRAFEEGGEQSRQVLARQAASWIAEIRNGLSPDRADEVISQFTDALAAAAEDNGPEARAALEDIFRTARIEIPTAALDRAFADTQANIKKTRDEALAAAKESRDLNAEIQRRRDDLKGDQDARMKALEATFPSDEGKRAEEAAKRVTEIQLSGRAAFDDARRQGDSRAAILALKAAEDQAKKIQDQAKEQEREGTKRKDQEAAIAALRKEFAGENARLEGQLAQEAYDRQIQQIKDRATTDLAKAQEKYDQDIANLNITLGLVASITTAADAMFDGALADIEAIVAQSSTLATALQSVTPGGIGGALNEAAASDAQDLGARAVNIGTLNVTNNGYMGEGGPEALAAEMVEAEESLLGAP
jgi:hypothetical protein